VRGRPTRHRVQEEALDGASRPQPDQTPDHTKINGEPRPGADAHHAAPRPASHAREADPPLCLFLSAISAFCLSFARFFSSLSASFLSFLISLFFRPLYGFPPAAAGIEAEAGAWA
jgi:hypothetical protein